MLHVCVSISMTNHVLVRDYEPDFSDECDCNGHSYTQLESCGMQLSFLIMRRPYDAFRAHGVNGCHSEYEQIQRPKTHQTFYWLSFQTQKAPIFYKCHAVFSWHKEGNFSIGEFLFLWRSFYKQAMNLLEDCWGVSGRFLTL